MAIDLRPQDLKPERIDTYKDWQAEQKIPVVRGFFVEDINTVELEYWDLKGVPSSFVVLDGTGGTNDAYVCEISAGGKETARSTHSSGDPEACSPCRSTPTTSTSTPVAARWRATSP